MADIDNPKNRFRVGLEVSSRARQTSSLLGLEQEGQVGMLLVVRTETAKHYRSCFATDLPICSHLLLYSHASACRLLYSFIRVTRKHWLVSVLALQ